MNLEGEKETKQAQKNGHKKSPTTAKWTTW